MSPVKLAETKTSLQEFVRNNPVGRNFEVVAPSDDPASGIPQFGWLVNLPFAPFHAMSGVNQTAQAVHEFTFVTDRFARNIEDLAKETAWETELLVLKTRR